MSNLKITADLKLSGPTNLRAVVARIQSAFNKINARVTVGINANSIKNVAALSSNLKTLSADLALVSNHATSAAAAVAALSSAFTSLKAGTATPGATVSQVVKSTSTVSKSFADATTRVEAFGRVSGLALRRFLAFSIPAASIIGLIRALRSGLKSAIDFQGELIKVSQVTGRSIEQLRGLTDKIDELSTKLGVSSKSLIEVSTILSQAGLSATETKDALEALAKTTLSATFGDINKTAEGSVAILAQFKIGTENLEKALSSINSVSAKFAVESEDIISAIRRTGGVFAALSGDGKKGLDTMNELIALFTSVRATTRESAETIATGFRTIFTRIQRPRTIELLREFNIELRDAKGQFVGPIESIKRLNTALSEIRSTDPRFARIIEEVGGIRQVSKLIPLIKEYKTAQDALAVAQAGQNSLTKDAEIAQQKFSVQIAKVQEQFLKLARDIVNTNAFKSFLEGILSIAKGLANILAVARPLLPVLTSIAAIRIGTSALQFLGGFKVGFGGRGIKRFSSGGLVGGTGTGDTVPANLRKGSFVLTREAVKRYGISGPRMATADAASANSLLTPGEYVVPPEEVKQIGVGPLERMNAGGKPRVVEQLRNGKYVLIGPAGKKVGDIGKVKRREVLPLSFPIPPQAFYDEKFWVPTAKSKFLAQYRNIRFARRFGRFSDGGLFDKKRHKKKRNVDPHKFEQEEAQLALAFGFGTRTPAGIAQAAAIAAGKLAPPSKKGAGIAPPMGVTSAPRAASAPPSGGSSISRSELVYPSPSRAINPYPRSAAARAIIRRRRMFSKFGGASNYTGVAAAFAAPVIAESLSPREQDRTPNQRGLLGAVQYGSGGALIGGTIGASVGGPIGAGIGAALGGIGSAIFGFMSALEEAKKEIEEQKLSDALDKLSKSLTRFSTQDLPITSTNLKKLRDEINDVARPRAGETREQSRDRLSQELGGLQKLAGKILETSKSLEEFQKAGDGFGATLLQIMADIRGIPLSEVEKSYKDIIELQEKSKRVEKELLNSQRQFILELENSNILAEAVRAAAKSAEEFGDGLSVTLARINRDFSTFKSTFEDILTSSNRFAKPQTEGALTSVASIFGEQAEQLKADFRALDILRSKLPALITDAINANPGNVGEFDLAETIIRKIQEDPSFNGIGSGIKDRILAQIGALGTEDIVSSAQENIVDFVEGLIKPVEAFKQPLLEAAKAIDNNLNYLLASLIEGQRIEQKLSEERIKLININQETFRRQAEARARNSDNSNVLDQLPIGFSQQFFAQKQAELTKGPVAVANATDPVAIANSLAENRRRQNEIRQNLQKEQAEGTLNPQKISAAQDELTKLQRQSNNLRQALENLTDASNRSSEAQERLSRLENERTSRLNLGASFFGASSFEERNQIARGARLTQIVSRRGSFDGLPPEITSQVVNFLRQASDITLSVQNKQGRTEKITGEDLLNKLIRNSSIGGVKNPFGLTKDQEVARADAQAALLKAFTDSQAAQKVFIDDLKTDRDMFFSELSANQQIFLQEMAKNLQKGEVANKESLIQQNEARLNVVKVKQNAAAEVADILGTTDIKTAKQFTGNDLTKRIAELQKEFDELRKTAGLSYTNISGVLGKEGAISLKEDSKTERDFLLRAITTRTVIPTLKTEQRDALKLAIGRAGIANPDELIDKALARTQRKGISKETADRIGKTQVEQGLRRELAGNLLDVIREQIKSRGNAIKREINTSGAQLVSEFTGVLSFDQIKKGINNLDELNTAVGKLTDVSSISELDKEASELTATIASLAAQSAAAKEAIKNLEAEIANIKAGGAPAAKPPGFARGGIVPGFGRGDKVPALLEPGEFVLRRDAVKALGLDTAMSINKMATGGNVRETTIQKNKRIYREKIDKLTDEYEISGNIILQGLSPEEKAAVKSAYRKRQKVKENQRLGLGDNANQYQRQRARADAEATARLEKRFNTEAPKKNLSREERVQFIKEQREKRRGAIYERRLENFAKREGLTIEEARKVAEERGGFMRAGNTASAKAARKAKADSLRRRTTYTGGFGPGIVFGGPMDLGHRSIRSPGYSSVFRFKEGGLVPSLLEPGEAVFSKKDVSAIGLSNLFRANKMASGGLVGSSGSTGGGGGGGGGGVNNFAEMKSSVNNFLASVDKFAKAVQGIPTEIAVNINKGNISVNLNGASVLAGITKEVQAMIIEEVQTKLTALKSELREGLPA